MRRMLSIGIILPTVLGISGDLSVSSSEVEIKAHNSELHWADDEENVDTTRRPPASSNQSAVPIPDHIRECGIWLAPSAIKGAGLGMYAGRDYDEEENLQYMGDPVIPIVDKHLHNRERKFKFLWDEYIWNDWVVGTDVEAYDNADGASPGFGSTANSFIPLVNVEEGEPRRSSTGFHRSKDPGAGAFSYYYNRQNRAKRAIQAGEEFYVDYGEHWFRARKYLGPIPLGNDLEKATGLFNAYKGLKHTLPNVSTALLDDLWDTFVRNTAYKASRVFGSFQHNDKDELLELEKAGSMKKLRIQQATKTQEWLYEFGTCGDHIHGYPSTVEQAGRGAFATRDLPEGTIVAQVPLIHITNRSRLDMHYFENGPRSAHLGRRPPQLLLNYCYGHSESTLLLCPYGPTVNYVNHNQTQANVKIIWADPARGNFMPHLLDQDLNALEADDTAKLAFEMVATKPIREDDEIFLDYGDEWEEAWQKHVQSWKPADGAEDYATQEDLDHDLINESWRTVFERIRNPYPSNIRVECHVYFRDEEEWKTKSYKWIAEDFRPGSDSDHWFECDILRRYHRNDDEDDIEVYAAVPVYPNDDEDDEYMLMTDLPDMAFRFREKPYTSDMFLENAFRHDIRIPDEIFPDAWRNDRRQKS